MINYQTELMVLTKNIVNRSLKLKKGEKVFIDLMGEADSLVISLINEIYKVGAEPFIRSMPIPLLRHIIKDCSKEQMNLWGKQELYRLKKMDAYISIRADDNIFEFEDIDPEKFNYYLNHYAYPMTSGMANIGRYIILKYPNHSMAQLANMSTESFTDLYFKACNHDYDQMATPASNLMNLLAKTEQIRITSPGTDLKFSIKNIDNYFCNGTYNLPDGEVFTAPVVDSMEGKIRFNMPATFLGMVFDNIQLTIKKGEIIDFDCSDPQKFEDIITADDGAKRFGEFGIGLNPHLKKSVCNLLFDEKMSGSIHLALGHALPMADNGNVSSVHWDLVLSQLKEHGGGELYFDNKLVRKDGLFVIPELMHLNPIP